MNAKLLSALGLMLLITSLSLFLMDFSYSQEMGMEGWIRSGLPVANGSRD